MFRMMTTVCLLMGVSAATLADNWYGELSVGQAEQDSSIRGVTGFSEKDVSLGLQLGYRFLPFLSVEAGYGDLGEASQRRNTALGGSKTATQSTVTNLGLKALLSVGGKANLYVRGGVGWWDYQINHTDPVLSFRADDSGREFYYGGGVQLTMNDVLYMGLEYKRMDIEADVGNRDAEIKLENIALVMGVFF